MDVNYETTPLTPYEVLGPACIPRIYGQPGEQLGRSVFAGLSKDVFGKMPNIALWSSAVEDKEIEVLVPKVPSARPYGPSSNTNQFIGLLLALLYNRDWTNASLLLNTNATKVDLCSNVAVAAGVCDVIEYVR